MKISLNFFDRLRVFYHNKRPNDSVKTDKPTNNLPWKLFDLMQKGTSKVYSDNNSPKFNRVIPDKPLPNKRMAHTLPMSHQVYRRFCKLAQVCKPHLRL